MEAPQGAALAADPTSCERCGDFAPLVPVGRRWLCQSCVAKRHPVLAEPASTGLYVAWSFKLLRAMGGPAIAMWVGTSLLYNVVVALAQGAFSTDPSRLDPRMLAFAVTTMSVYLVVYVYCAAFQTALAAQAIDGAVDVRAAARLAGRKLSPALLSTSVASFAMFAGCLMCLVPGLVISLVWALPIPAIVVHGAGPLEALGRSFRAGHDAWTHIGLALSVAFVVLVGVLVLASAPLGGYVMLVMLESGPEAVAALSASVEYRVVGVLLGALSAIAYVPIVNVAAIAYLNRTEGAN